MEYIIKLSNSLDLSLAIAIIALLLSVLNYLRLEKHSRTLLELRIDSSVRKNITNDGYEIHLSNRSEYDLALKKIKVYYQKKQPFENIRKINLAKNMDMTIDLSLKNKNLTRDLLNIRPSEAIDAKIKIKCRSKYWGTKTIKINT